MKIKKRGVFILEILFLSVKINYSLYYYIVTKMFKTSLFKKIFSSLIISITVFWILPSKSFWNYSQNYFVVTAYYSPLPGQDYYLTWNYNDEIRLNGRWIAWASWKGVFSGMFAAPKKYEFWTKIFLSWLWAWSVEDRWGAIVPAGKRWYEHDRIDIWVWYWDEGLRRAMYWGKRKISWNIINGWSDITFNYKDIPAPMWVTKGFKKMSDIFTMNIWIWTDSKKVIELQKLLNKVWLYNWKLDWVYNDDVMKIIFEFQMRNNIIEWENSSWAWYWGNKTRNLFLQKYLNWEFDENQIEDIEETVTNENSWYDSLFVWTLNSKEKKVLLQKLLFEMWLYDWDIDWNYNHVYDIILENQISNNLVKSKDSTWAWTFWPKTRELFKWLYTKYLDENKRKIELDKKFKEIEIIVEKIAHEKIKNMWTPKFWEVSWNVRDLQKTLKVLWFFNYKDTAIFWDITKNSVLEYQLNNKLITNSKDSWAWVIWPKTKKSLKSDLKDFLMEKEIKEQELDKQYLLNIWVWTL